jgi:hypothetical protein
VPDGNSSQVALGVGMRFVAEVLQHNAASQAVYLMTWPQPPRCATSEDELLFISRELFASRVLSVRHGHSSQGAYRGRPSCLAEVSVLTVSDTLSRSFPPATAAKVMSTVSVVF